jgi:hypothetical protein
VSAVAIAEQAKATRDEQASRLRELEDAYDLALLAAAGEVGVSALAQMLGVARWTVTRRIARVRKAMG